MKALFADIDGVCHPEGAPDLRHAGKVYGWCAENNVALVITSNWRLSHTRDELLALFLGAHPHRGLFFDVTPDLLAGKGGRQKEIEAWLSLHPDVDHYIAVDDNPWLFDEDCDWLHLCNPRLGLTDKDFEKLSTRFGNNQYEP